MKWRLWATTLVVALAVACSSSGSGTDTDLTIADAAPDAVTLGDNGQDGAAMDLAAEEVHRTADIVAETSGAKLCLDIAPSGAFTLLPDAPLTQIHAAVAFDGQGLWVTYNLPDDDKKFDAWATRLACDGSILTPPFQLNKLSDANETDPCISIKGDIVLTAWQSDNGQAPSNLDIFYRIFTVAGEPVMATDAALEMLMDGQPQLGNAWMAQAVPAGQGFELLGAVALKGANGFQAAVQPVAADGALPGTDVTAVAWDPDVSQVYPSAATGPQGQLAVAWTRSAVDESDRVEWAVRPPGSADFDAVQDAGVDGASTPALGGNSNGLYLAYTGPMGSKSAPHVRTAESSGEPLAISAGSSLDHSPAVVPTPSGGLVVWYRNQGGIKNDVWVQAFDANEGALEKDGLATKMNDGFAAAYPAAVAHIEGESVVVVWSEGTSPDFVMKGRFSK